MVHCFNCGVDLTTFAKSKKETSKQTIKESEKQNVDESPKESETRIIEKIIMKRGATPKQKIHLEKLHEKRRQAKVAKAQKQIQEKVDELSEESDNEEVYNPYSKIF